MTHATPNPHDAEEAMRPLLGKVHDAAEAVVNASSTDDVDEAFEVTEKYATALQAALVRSLELLGVQR